MRAITSVSVVVAALGFALPRSAVASQPFDGNWSVEVITDKGSCERVYRWDVVIANGRIATAADMPTGATGVISPAGLVSASFVRGNDHMVASGSASGKWANGEWVASSLSCSGRWRAERRS